MTSSTTPPNGIVFFHYHESPYARRVAWYLAFRQIAYVECIQPPIMPRPDLAALGINYRRTPTMAIGRDVYLDSRHILARLENLFPPSPTHPAFSSKETAGLAALLDKFSTDASLFVNATTIMPPDLPIFKNEAFMKDRAEFFGTVRTVEERRGARAQGLVNLRCLFDVVESLFADGRRWVGETEGVGSADLEGIWAVDWIITGLSPPKEYFSAEIYPKTYDWHRRFKKELEAARARAPKPVKLSGADAVNAVLDAEFTDTDLIVDPKDPFRLEPGASVELYPTDSGGFTHKDKGRLVKLTRDDVAVAVQSQRAKREVHVHAPRWNFRVAEAGGARL